MSNKPTEISSAGSLVLFKSEIFEKGIRFRGPYDTGLLVGVCNDARKLGYRTWINPNASVIHPTTLWYEQAWVLSGVNITVSGKTLRIACKEVVDFPYAETLKPLVLKALNAQSRIPGGRYSFAIQKNTESRTLTLEIQDEMPHCDPVFLVIKE